MVFYFTSSVVDPPAQIYMGKDKFENEDLIKWGWEEDVWFHVDKLSSAHVYLRIPKDAGYTWETIPEDLIVDCAQLTKANSIEGSKKNNITIIYTPWSNLKKTGAMDTGQVAFHKDNLVKRIHVEKKDNFILNRLNKTKQEKQPDLEREKLDKQKSERASQRKDEKVRKQEELKLREERQKMDDVKHYKDVFKDDSAMSLSNRSGIDIDEDFM
ncbi:DUF814-domain-containing protein [Gonapodya prolifera JEL478]|uniref:DUF814-domain-containing protein n=1 Tax=Gonapodya prolifera (strain JEL478) TaxID=1344416 RepID=A0A139A0Y2_GONPJ|nr:DUF814-domain-containing protein [Gonapodya prolifera JEL478]|eukprot:KXS10421.1 DUF814-domain-containing protein [Gonapodya prolifera JEL478]